MRIGFDAKRLFNNFTGLGNYSRTLLSGLIEFYPDNEYLLFSPKVKEKRIAKSFLGSGNLKIIQPGKIRLFWRTFSVINDINKNNTDIYHGLSNELPIGIHKKKVKTIVTIHDLIFKRFPGLYPFFDTKIYDYKFRYSCQNANRIIAISESTKQDIVNYYKVSPSKIDVVYQGCNEIFNTHLSENEINEVLNKNSIPEEYLLYVGSITRRKNVLSIIKAIEMLPRKFHIPLVIIGNGLDYKKEILQYISKRKLGHRVKILSNISSYDLPALYQKAEVFIYPSLYEGFGIPVLEALYSKTPVITSNLSSLPEAGGNAALYVNPCNFEEIAMGIKNILGDKKLRKNMIERGYRYAQNFNKQNITSRVFAIYQNLLS